MYVTNRYNSHISHLVGVVGGEHDNMSTPLLPDQTPELLHTCASQWAVTGYELLLSAITLHVQVVDNQSSPDLYHTCTAIHTNTMSVSDYRSQGLTTW